MSLKELIKPGRQKLLVDFVLSVVWLMLVFFHPFFGYDRMLSSYDVPMKAAVLAVNLLVFLLLFYLMSCGLVYVYGLLAKKKKRSGRLDLAVAVFFILIFNPVFVSLAAIGLDQLNDSMNRPCGVEITGFAGVSAARDAGMSEGEVIVSADGYPADTVDALKHVLGGKRAGDHVTVRTDRKEYRVVVQDSPDMSAGVIGVSLKQRYCPR